MSSQLEEANLVAEGAASPLSNPIGIEPQLGDGMVGNQRCAFL